MICITAIIRTRNDANEALKNIFEPLVSATRNEQGCHCYEVHGTKDDTDTFLILEEWQSQENIAAHNQSAHFKQFITAIQPLLAAPLQIYVSEKWM